VSLSVDSDEREKKNSVQNFGLAYVYEKVMKRTGVCDVFVCVAVDYILFIHLTKNAG
jgi:hypothetical protein